MRDRLRMVVTALMTCNAAFAQNRPPNSVLDPAFATIPFDRWLTEQDQAHFQWSAKISGGQLANSQRLSARVDVQVDGNKLVKRRGIGELAFFVQFSDSDRRLFQSTATVACFSPTARLNCRRLQTQPANRTSSLHKPRWWCRAIITSTSRSSIPGTSSPRRSARERVTVGYGSAIPHKPRQ
jgi:hypothetical protein